MTPTPSAHQSGVPPLNRSGKNRKAMNAGRAQSRHVAAERYNVTRPKGLTDVKICEVTVTAVLNFAVCRQLRQLRGRHPGGHGTRVKGSQGSSLASCKITRR